VLRCRALAAACVVAVITVTGCGSAASLPTAGTTASSATPAARPPSPTAARTRSAPPRAPALDERVAAAEHWVRAADRAYTAGDTGPLRRASLLPGCQSCQRALTEATRIWQPGYRRTGDKSPSTATAASTPTRPTASRNTAPGDTCSCGSKCRRPRW
jgi:hypothetical protein